MNMQAKYFDEQPTMMNCAMNFGLIVGGYYIVKFCLFPLALHSTFVSMVFLGLTAVVPFLIYMLVKRYRDQYHGGLLEFSRAYVFSVLTMGFGSLLAAAAHYIYFAYIDGGNMMAVLMQNIEQLQSFDLSAVEGATDEAIGQFNQYIEALQQTAHQIEAMTPIQLAMGMLSNNFSWSVILSLPIALFASVRKPRR